MNELIKRDYIVKVNSPEHAKLLLKVLIKYHKKQNISFGYTKLLIKHHDRDFKTQNSGIDGSIRLEDMTIGSFKSFVISTYLTYDYIYEILNSEHFGLITLVGKFDIWEMS